MFVYQNHAQKSSSSVLVVMSALLFGGMARMVSFLPVAACILTVLTLAWCLTEDPLAEEPMWVPRLSLASTGLLYLGLGYCLGGVAIVAAPMMWRIAKEL